MIHILYLHFVVTIHVQVLFNCLHFSEHVYFYFPRSVDQTAQNAVLLSIKYYGSLDMQYDYIFVLL